MQLDKCSQTEYTGVTGTPIKKQSITTIQKPLFCSSPFCLLKGNLASNSVASFSLFHTFHSREIQQ